MMLITAIEYAELYPQNRVLLLAALVVDQRYPALPDSPHRSL
ncbi:MAG: hypothetical protein QNJ69_06015 [Gammaproteobacteria bacterium]|nr:hypothetical protein [Gammaproteobacteria bacterium]